MKKFSRIKWILLPLAILLACYLFRAYERMNGQFIGAYPSDDGRYTAEIFELREPAGDEDSFFEVKIKDASGQVVKTSSEYNASLNNVFWLCENQKCNTFLWGNEDGHLIEMPPSFMDRLLSRVP